MLCPGSVVPLAMFWYLGPFFIYWHLGPFFIYIDILAPFWYIDILAPVSYIVILAPFSYQDFASLQDYSDAATVHGVSYIFQRDQTAPHRLLWLFIVSMGVFVISMRMVILFSRWDEEFLQVPQSWFDCHCKRLQQLCNRSSNKNSRSN